MAGDAQDERGVRVPEPASARRNADTGDAAAFREGEALEALSRYLDRFRGAISTFGQ